MLKNNSYRAWMCLMVCLIGSTTYAQHEIRMSKSVYWDTEPVSFGLAYTNDTGSTVTLSNNSCIPYSYQVDETQYSNLLEWMTGIHFQVMSYLYPGMTIVKGFTVGDLNIGTHTISGSFYNAPAVPATSVFEVIKPTSAEYYHLDFDELTPPVNGDVYADTGIRFTLNSSVFEVDVEDTGSGDMAMTNLDTVRFYQPQWRTKLDLLTDMDCQLSIEVDYSSDGAGDFIQFEVLDMTANAAEQVEIFLPDHHFIHAVRLTASDGNFFMTKLVSEGGRIYGDLNFDDRVDARDLLILKSNYGLYSGAIYTMGDLNWDQSVTIADFLLLKSMYGIRGIR